MIGVTVQIMDPNAKLPDEIDIIPPRKEDASEGESDEDIKKEEAEGEKKEEPDEVTEEKDETEEYKDEVEEMEIEEDDNGSKDEVTEDDQ